MAADPASAPPPPPPPGPPHLPPPPAGYAPPVDRPRWSPTPAPFLAGGAILAVGITLLALWAAQFGPFARPSDVRGPLTYSEAASQVEAALAQYDGGGWSPVFAGGLSASAPISENLSELPTAIAASGLGRYGCTYTSAPGAPAQLAVPGRSVAASNGSLDAWVIFLRNGSDGIEVAADVDGAVARVASLGGGECGILIGLLGTIPSSGDIDSPEAFQVALANGGAAFLQGHPMANVTLALTPTEGFGTFATSPSRWSVTLTDCSVGANGTLGKSGSAWAATVWASNGTFGTAATTTSGCTGSLPSLPSLPGLARAANPPLPVANGRSMAFIQWISPLVTYLEVRPVGFPY